MPKFNLKRDEKHEVWWRYRYTVEADTLEDAIKQVLEDEIDPYDGDMTSTLTQDPLETEILDENDNKVYDSKQL